MKFKLLDSHDKIMVYTLYIARSCQHRIRYTDYAITEIGLSSGNSLATVFDSAESLERKLRQDDQIL